MQMRTRFEESGFSKTILQNSTHILSFIKHALEPSSSTSASTSTPSRSGTSTRPTTSGLTLQSLHIVDEIDEHDEGGTDFEGDSDDEDAPGLEGVNRADEMMVTAVNLLLSVLEGEQYPC